MAWGAIEDTGSVSMEDRDSCGLREFIVIFRGRSQSSCIRCSGEIMREQQKGRYSMEGWPT